MARVTIEDCLELVDDRFELVALAAQRAKDIASGAELTIERNGEKDTVISLREIADKTVDCATLKQEAIQSLQKERISSVVEFAAPINRNSASSEEDLSIEQEEADIRAAIADATEADFASDEEFDEDSGFSESESPLETE